MDAETSGLQDPKPYSRDDRLRQLHDFAAACEAAGGYFTQHGPHDLGRAYVSVAEEAKRLLSGGFADADLHELGRAVPGRPVWMDPKKDDYYMPWDGWQETASESVLQAEGAALDLRAVATFEG